MDTCLKNETAVTLIEALFCAVLFMFIAAACVALLFRGWDSWQTTGTQVQISQEITQSVSSMADEIMQSGASVMDNVPADNNVYTQISFSKVNNVSGGNVVWGPLINYSLGGPGGQQLIRTQNSQARVIAAGITSLQFFRLTALPNVVNVLVTASVPTYRGDQQLTSTLSFKVFLHNS